MVEGDLFGLGLALEAAAEDGALAEDHAAGAQEKARLAGLAAPISFQQPDRNLRAAVGLAVVWQ